MASLKTVAQNKKAHHDYFIEESFEAGIELCGTEVKSIRAGRVNLKDSWCSIVEGEIFINGMHISPYDHGNIFNRDPMRVRKLLMHKKEINRLFGIVKQTGYSLIPISLYFKDSKVKVQVGLCKGKKLYDKREDMAKRSAKRDMERAIKEQNRFKLNRQNKQKARNSITFRNQNYKSSVRECRKNVITSDLIFIKA